eukprot:scaffold101_cov373-Prasinococcus_capsulatus_cf.AAC.6
MDPIPKATLRDSTNLVHATAWQRDARDLGGRRSASQRLSTAPCTDPPLASTQPAKSPRKQKSAGAYACDPRPCWEGLQADFNAVKHLSQRAFAAEEDLAVVSRAGRRRADRRHETERVRLVSEAQQWKKAYDKEAKARKLVEQQLKRLEGEAVSDTRAAVLQEQVKALVAANHLLSSSESRAKERMQLLAGQVDKLSKQLCATEALKLAAEEGAERANKQIIDLDETYRWRLSEALQKQATERHVMSSTLSQLKTQLNLAEQISSGLDKCEATHVSSHAVGWVSTVTSHLADSVSVGGQVHVPGKELQKHQQPWVRRQEWGHNRELTNGDNKSIIADLERKEATIGELNKLVLTLEGQSTRATQDVERLNKDVANLQDLRVQLERKLEQTQQDLVSAQSKIADLSEKEIALEESQMQVKSLSSDVSDLVAQLNERDGRMPNDQTRGSSSETQVAFYTDELLEIAKKQLEEREQDLEQQLRTAQEYNEIAQEELASYREQCEALEDEKEGLVRQVEALSLEMAAMAEERTKQDLAFATVQQQAATDREQCESLAAALDELRAAKRQKEEELLSLQGMLAILKEEATEQSRRQKMGR